MIKSSLGRIILLASLLGLLSICLSIPIYTDELAWHIALSRVFDDGFVYFAQLPQCSDRQSVNIPYLLIPGRIFSSIVFYKISPPYLLRFIGVGLALLFCFVVFKILNSHNDEYSRDGYDYRVLSKAIFILTVTLGLGPAVWSLARPEGIFSVILMTLTLIVLRYSRRDMGILITTLFVILSLSVFSLHPKGLFFLPLLLSYIWVIKIPFRAVIIKILMTILILLGAFQSVSYYSTIYDCPNAPNVAYEIGSHMVNPKLGLQLPLAYIQQLIHNLTTLYRYADAVVPPKSPVFWGWLPDHDLGVFDELWKFSIKGSFWFITTIVFFGFIVASYQFIFDKKRSVHTFQSLIFLGCHLGLISHQTITHHYDGVFNLTFLGISAAILINRIKIPVVGCKYIYRTIISVISINLLCFACAYGSLLTRAYKLGVEGEYPHQFHSGIQLFNYSTIANKLWKLSKQCNIDLRKETGILVDDISYPFTQRSHRVLHTMGVTWWAKPGDDQYKVLQDAQISSVIAGCNSLKPELVDKAKKLGEFCCLQIKPNTR